MMKRIKLVPHDSAWAGQYLKEKRALEKILCGYVNAVHHGKTTIGYYCYSKTPRNSGFL